jgi:molecular chaperone HscB
VPARRSRTSPCLDSLPLVALMSQQKESTARPLQQERQDVICWSCERAAGNAATCSYCHVIQPPDPKADYFGVLGVPQSYALDLDVAETLFRELSRQFHPDRFAKADPRARRASLQRSVQLNEAWRTLKDPIRRAEYVLRRAGYDIGAESGASAPASAATEPGTQTGTGGGDQPAHSRIPVPPALLGEILELREELGDARAAGDDARVQEMAADMRGRIDAALRRVADGFGGVGRNQGDRAEILEAVARDLIAIRYFRRFLDEVAVHDEAIAAGAEAVTHA